MSVVDRLSCLDAAVTGHSRLPARPGEEPVLREGEGDERHRRPAEYVTVSECVSVSVNNEVRRKGRILTAPRRRLPHGITHTCQFIGKVVCRDLKTVSDPATEPARADSDNRDCGPEKPLRSSHKAQSQTRKAKIETEVEATPPKRRRRASRRRPPPSEPGKVAIDCGESLPSNLNAEGAQPGDRRRETCETWATLSSPCIEKCAEPGGLRGEREGGRERGRDRRGTTSGRLGCAI